MIDASKQHTSTVPNDCHVFNKHIQEAIALCDRRGDLKSSEGTTQGDPLAMPWFLFNTRRLINVLAEQTEVKQA